MKRSILFSYLLVSMLTGFAQQPEAISQISNANTSEPEPGRPKEYTFASTPTWADEFDYEGLPDDDKWEYDVDHKNHVWGNNELQYYTEKRLENAQVGNGVLTITAMKECYAALGYTSARLVSREKADFLYGRFEVRTKLPPGRGT